MKARILMLKSRMTRQKLLVVQLVAIVLHVGCSSVPEGARVENTLVLKDSGKKIRATGVGEDGQLRYSNYEGQHVVLGTVVAQVDLLPNKMESFRSEDESAWFMIKPGRSIPALPKIRFIELWFDHRELLLPRPFSLGEEWDIVLTERGELVDRRLSTPNK